MPVWGSHINVAVSADGTKVAYVRSSFFPPAMSSKDDFTVHIWDIQSGREIQTLKAGRVFEFHFSPNGKLLGTLSTDNLGGLLWDIETGALVQPHKNGLRCKQAGGSFTKLPPLPICYVLTKIHTLRTNRLSQVRR